MSKYLIRQARMMDPATGRDEIADLFIRNGNIEPVPLTYSSDVIVVQADGLVAAPAFLDVHVHFREPGGEIDETMASGCRAAFRGGFGAVVTMPNTKPAIDNPLLVQAARQEARRVCGPDVSPAACISQERKGQALTDLAALRTAGVEAVTDDGSTVADDALLRDAMTCCARLGLLVMDHAHDPVIERQGVMHAGAAADRLGLPGIPAQAESRIVARDLAMAAETGCRLHVQHVSAGESVELLRQARQKGVAATAEVTPHHLALCDEDIPGPDARYKMNPPLRSRADRDALRQAVLDGVIDCFATDHAPHSDESKKRGFLDGPFGVIGLETAASVTHTVMVLEMGMPLMQWLHCWTVAPAQILRRKPPSLDPGQPANLVLFDPDAVWNVNQNQFLSKSKNTCFINWTLTGRVMYTFFNGSMVWREFTFL